MNIYLISQETVCGWDTHDSAIVAARSPDEAREVHPSEFVTHSRDGKWMGTYTRGRGEYTNESSCWVPYRDRGKIKVELLGTTTREAGLILSSFNAG